MAKDITFNRLNWLDGTGGSASSFPCAGEYVITDGGIDIRVLADSTNTYLSLDVSANYFEISVCGKNIYKYENGDTLNTGVINNAQTMYESIRDLLTSV
jgi:hypothetical protein